VPKAGRTQQKNPPQKREPMNKAKAEKPPKKSLYELCQQRKHEIHDVKREKDDAAKQVLYRQQEDDIMAMTYGPNWRGKQLPGDPEPPKTKLSPPVESIDEDDDDDEDYGDYPDSGDSRVRLKAS
jgi:hypothetical protein